MRKLAEKNEYSVAKQGKFPVLKVMEQWRIRRAGLDGWISAQTKRRGQEVQR